MFRIFVLSSNRQSRQCQDVAIIKKNQETAPHTADHIFSPVILGGCILILCLPVLGNVEAPLELEMSLLVVVDKAGDGIIVATSEHSRRGFLLLDYNARLVHIFREIAMKEKIYISWCRWVACQ